VLAAAGLGEERVERVVLLADRRVVGLLAVGLNAVFEAEQLPARIACAEPSERERKRKRRVKLKK